MSPPGGGSKLALFSKGAAREDEKVARTIRTDDECIFLRFCVVFGDVQAVVQMFSFALQLFQVQIGKVWTC